jgi:aminoglycoside phosphotransferase (APT) family kinase protein
MTDGRDVPGIGQVARLERWLMAGGRREVPGGPAPADDGAAAGKAAGAGLAGVRGIAGVRLIAGGRSNLTYLLDLAPGSEPERLVLRRPPLGHVLPTAHDMSREYRVLHALGGTDVPVPAVVAFCDDESVIGAPFYLMEYVAGSVLRTREDAAALTPGQASELSEQLAVMLARIHGVDVEAAGLSGFGRPGGYLRRQLSRWQRQWELSATRELPEYDRLVARLEAGLPEDSEGTLVHGDFRLDNVLVTLHPRAPEVPGTTAVPAAPSPPPAPEGPVRPAALVPRIAAVMDWEMSTLGDPLADLGLTLTYWTDPGEEGWLATSAGEATARPGFASRAGFAARYAELTGRDVSGIAYYMAFGCFKLAVVLEGIHARYLQRKTVGEGFGREGEAVPALIARAHRVLDTGSVSPGDGTGA